MEPIERELELKRLAFEAGNLGALLDALIICNQERPLPEWAVLGLIDTFKDVLNKTRDGRRWRRRYRQVLIDLERAETVQECRDHGIRWTDGEVYERAAEILTHTKSAAVGSARAIEKSYLRVKRNGARNPMEYHILRSIVLGRSPSPGGRK